MKWKKYLFMLVVFSLFSIPYSIMGMHLFNIIKEISVRDMLFYMDLRNRVIANDIYSVLISRYDVLKICRDKKFMDIALEEKKNELIKLAKSDPIIIKEISIINSNGQEIFSTIKNKKLSNFKDDPVFINANNEYFSIGAVNYPYDEPPVLTIAEPIIKIKGQKPDYIFMARLNLGYLNEEIMKRVKKYYGKITLVDAGQQIIFDSDYNYLFKPGVKAENQISRIIKGLIKNNSLSYSGVLNMDGIYNLVSISNIESTAWWIYEKKNRDNVIDYSLYRWARRVFIIGFMVLAAFSYIAYRLAVSWKLSDE